MTGAMLQRKCGCGGTCGGCAKNEAPPIVHDVVRSQGRPLDASTRSYMEPRFGADFSRVRVHSGGDAARSADAVGARAYTVGQHIVTRDAVAPQSHQGKSLLAHELAHTIQQRNAAPDQGPLPVSRESDASEHEADGMARAAAAGRVPPPATTSAPRVSRATREFLLTFDDGPHSATLCKGINHTEKVLDTLCDQKIQAGFFVQTAAEDAAGHKIRGSSPVGQKLIKRMNTDGHLIGIHTGGKTDHELHTTAQAAGRLEPELTGAKAELKTLTGKTPTMVRPPKRVFNKAVTDTYKKLSLSNTLWDIDADNPGTKKAASLAEIKTNITKDLKTVSGRKWKGSTPLDPRIVVLMHDLRPSTADNLPAIIDHIRKETKALGDDAKFPGITCKKPDCKAEVKPKVTKEKPKQETKPKKETPKDEKEKEKEKPTPKPAEKPIDVASLDQEQADESEEEA
jgi:peptidoglycan/xylan/chitin deacetylase (PgdA/CDA1 family)